jgi:ABC-type Na+ efflux pump permease subunit
MFRARALKVVMVTVGLLFSAAAYPAVTGVLHSAQSDSGDTMMMSLYATLGVFLLIAARNPAEHRSLIAFTAWSCFAHAAVMSLLGIPMAAERQGFLAGSAILAVIGVALLALGPLRRAEEAVPGVTPD